MVNFWDSFKEAIVSLFLTVIGYLSPLKSMAHLVLFFFLLDVIYGWLVDRKMNKAKFKPSIVWCKTMPRVVLSVILLILSFMLDNVTGQHYVSTYKLIGWFICSLLFISILKNGYILTGWEAIPLIGKMVKKNVKEETGIELEE